jgi:hypothetical protein
MANGEIGVELMQLHHLLKAEPDPKVKAAIRQRIDRLLEHAHTVLPATFAGVRHDKNT